MSVRRYHFTGPYHDPYGAAFCLYKPGEINWRHRIIAGVSWNGQTQEAFFFNPDGLTIPLRVKLYAAKRYMGREGMAFHRFHVSSQVESFTHWTDRDLAAMSYQYSAMQILDIELSSSV